MKKNVLKKHIENNGRIGFLMLTYDGGSFLWDGHFRLIKKYWPSFPNTFDDYYSTSETKPFEFGDGLLIKSIGCGPGSTFSERIALAIQELGTEYIFVTIDDYYIKSPVDEKRFLECFDFVKNNKKIDYIEFENFRSTVRKNDYCPNYIKKLKKGMFLVNLQIGIWRANSLLKIMRLYENPWQLEYYGSIRGSLRNFNAFTLRQGEKPIFDYDFGWLVQRGKFDKITFDYFVKNENLDSKLGDLVGFRERSIVQNSTIFTKLKHILLALLSIFRR